MHPEVFLFQLLLSLMQSEITTGKITSFYLEISNFYMEIPKIQDCKIACGVTRMGKLL